jgi:PilZ domain
MGPKENPASPAIIRRWPRHQVALPVRIATGESISTVDGLATEISRGGMALYGGIPLELGDLMAVEFPTSSPVCVAGIIRNRSGFCYGLEFLSVVMSDPNAANEFKPTTADSPQNASPLPQRTDSSLTKAEDKLVALFLERHAAYLRNKEQEIERVRQKALKAREVRHEIEGLAEGLRENRK